MQSHSFTFQRSTALSYNFANATIEGVGEGYMANDAALEEGERSDTFCAVDHLVWHHEVSWFDLFLQTSRGTESDNGTYTDAPQSSNVGTSRNLVWCKLMMNSMTC